MMKPYELAAADQRRQRIKAHHDIDLEKDNPGGHRRTVEGGAWKRSPAAVSTARETR